MKTLKSKTVIGIIAIIIGILVCFIFTPLYNKSIEAKTKIIRVNKKIEKGQLITEDMLKVVEVGSYNLPQDIISQKNQVSGKYAASELYPDEYIIPEKLLDTPLSKNNYLEGLDGSHGAISITLQSFAAGLSGKLLSGDIVSIIYTDTEDKLTKIPPELTFVKVLACTTNNGNDLDEKSYNDNQEEEGNNNSAATVTLLVNGEQARTLAALESLHKVHIELVYRGTKEKCNELLEQQNTIIKDMNGENAPKIIDTEALKGSTKEKKSSMKEGDTK